MTGKPPIELTVQAESNYHRVTRLGKEIKIGNNTFCPERIEVKGSTTMLIPHMQFFIEEIYKPEIGWL